MSKSTKSKKPKKKSSKRIIFILSGVVFIVVGILYIYPTIFFMSHYFPDTEINGRDFSFKTVSDADTYFKNQLDDYNLSIIDKDNLAEIIAGKDISLDIKGNQAFENVLHMQNVFLWPISLFKKTSHEITLDVIYDQNQLNEKIHQLPAVTKEQIPSENARPEFDGNQYVIIPEVFGTEIDVAQLEAKIKQYISELKAEINIFAENCYVSPKYVSSSKEVQDAYSTMTLYANTSVIYPMSDPVVVDKALISTWLHVDEDLNVLLDSDAIRKWLSDFGDKYDTVGATRTFITPTGKSAAVTGGTYGWSIDEDQEFEVLLNNIKNGDTITREPAYYIDGTAATHNIPDWGNTYIDVDLSEQHMWYISNGTIALETDVVTGVPIPEKITPEGTYTILEKALNEVLVGEINPNTGKPEYTTTVTYWMRVTWSGVGFHDAIWQSAFGGSLNQNPDIGSHGCINMPLSQAAALFDIIETGTPVVIHY